MSMETPFFRVRWTLRARATWSLHSPQNAILYALLCGSARGADGDGPAYMPDGLLLDAPEQCRDRYEPGEQFAFGATLIEFEQASATRRLNTIADGLTRLGRTAPREPTALGGNFDLVDVQDLVAQRSVAPGEPFLPLGADIVTRELEQLSPMVGAPLTLRFRSPLRLERPGADAEDGHRYADGTRLHAGQLLRAVQKRIAAIGLRRRNEEHDPPFDDASITLLENRLTWLDLEYGRRDRRRSLGGALGRISIQVHDSVALAALVWGQYARVGRNLHFGFGRYRIEELGPDPTECQRARPLLDLCLRLAAIALAAADHGIEPDDFQRAAEQLRVGTYRPGRTHRVTLRSGDGDTRELQIPTVQDRALQRLLLARLGPALDRLVLKTSSFAWRRGLSRESAARRIERLVHDGWHFAVRADFDRFFDRIPRSLMRDRLEAWLGDDAATAAVWRFVDRDSEKDVGIPTGAPLSPLLGNLLLDRFDESIEQEGGRLVRYADDFLILTRRREDAERLHSRAHDLASDLLLQLNADSAVIDLREPFEFLGFQFCHEERVAIRAGPSGPRRVQELGWKDADRAPSPLAIPLPQETPQPAHAGIVVAGPGITHLDVVGSSLKLRGPDHGDDVDVSLNTIERLILLGPASWTPDAPGKLLRAGVPVHLVSEGGWPMGDLLSDPADDPEAVKAQCRAASDPAVALILARPLVRAKLRNFAALLEAAAHPGEPTAARLREIAEQSMTAASLDALRGHEGAAAAAWYRRMPALLGKGFTFRTRARPMPTDPGECGFEHRPHDAPPPRNHGLPRKPGSRQRSAFCTQAADGRYAAARGRPSRTFFVISPSGRQSSPRACSSRRSSSAAAFEGPYRLDLDHHASQKFHALLQRQSWRTAVTRGARPSRAPGSRSCSPPPAR